uniref:Piwi domain-containing protein n=1 Tax=Panagrellus redivivus TaxID=6233 RepID=A0A7E4ZTR8_PANRE
MHGSGTAECAEVSRTQLMRSRSRSLGQRVACSAHARVTYPNGIALEERESGPWNEPIAPMDRDLRRTPSRGHVHCDACYPVRATLLPGYRVPAMSVYSRTRSTVGGDLSSQMESMSLSSTCSLEMPPKPEPGTMCYRRIDITTNMHGIAIPEDLKVYRYDVTIQATKQRPDGTIINVDFTKREKADSTNVARKTACVQIMNEVFKHYKFVDSHRLIYDMQSTLLAFHEQIQPDVLNVTLEVEHPNPSPEHEGYTFAATIRVAGNGEPITREQLDNCHMPGKTHELQQAIELLTSQVPFRHPEEHVPFPGGKSFLICPKNYGFNDADTPNITGYAYLAVGVQKSSRIIEGPRGPGNRRAAIVVTTKKTPFFGPYNFLQSVSSVCNSVLNNEQLSSRDLDRMKRIFHGVRVRAIYGSKRVYTVSSFARETAHTAHFMDPTGNQITVAEYLFNTYGVTLRYPDTNLVQESGSKKSLIPMELLVVEDNQRIRSEQQNPQMVADLTRKCAIPPSELRVHNMLNAESIGISDRNPSPYVTAVDCKVMGNPMPVKQARVLPAPQMVYNGGAANYITKTWNQGQLRYLVPAKLQQWLMVVISDPRRTDDFNEHRLRQLYEAIATQAKRCGMTIGMPGIYKIGVDIDDLRNVFEKCSIEGVKYAFFVHTDADNTLHNETKRFEKSYGVVTQLIRMRNATDIVVKNRRAVTENVVHKMNIKLGGVNYELRLPEASIQASLGAKTLCIGVALNHPGAINPSLRASIGTVPTIVGYAANDKASPFEFVGNFILQTTNKEDRVHDFGAIVMECVNRFTLARGFPPERVFVFRNGCPEGQYNTVLATEVRAITRAMQSAGCHATLSFITTNKLHNVRFMKENAVRSEQPAEQNIPSGTIIDTKVVHPVYHEFYLNAHTAIQGTAKTPRFTVLYDDNHLSSDALQLLCYTLCFGHQIVCLPTSLPSPVYIASRYAERGRAIVTSQMRSENETSIEEMTYKGALRDVRINA